MTHYSLSLQTQPLPALVLTPDAVQINTKQLMGRQSAGNGFLRALFHSPQASAANEPLTVLTYHKESYEPLQQTVRQTGWQGEVQFQEMRYPKAWQGFDVLYYPAPISSEMAWQRARVAPTQFAMCGVTHTICSHGVVGQIAKYLTDPFTPWDALICTSNSVLQAVHAVWDAQWDYLERRLGRKTEEQGLASARAWERLDRPMTPVIPLGVHCADFETGSAERIAGRAQWDIAADEVVVLFVGRLSMHAKANPFPMYLACARAAAKAGKKVHFVECGWYANDAIKATFNDAARIAGVKVTHIDGRQAGYTRRAYAAADIFISLSDNIQETFGLTPVEAMAAGLPVVVSDWDGYRETVRDGVDGFLIPTTQARDEAVAADFLHAYVDERINYDLYVANMHMQVAVDIPACTDALVRLIEREDLRRSMGQAGRERARQIYDWQVVMAQYQDLWAEQRQILQANGQASRSSVGVAWTDSAIDYPSQMNPFAMFAHYPSQHITPQSVLQRERAEVMSLTQLQSVRQMTMWGFANGWFPAWDRLQALVVQIPEVGTEGESQPKCSVQDWAQMCKMSVIEAIRLATWLHKVGYVRLIVE